MAAGYLLGFSDLTVEMTSERSIFLKRFSEIFRIIFKWGGGRTPILPLLGSCFITYNTCLEKKARKDIQKGHAEKGLRSMTL